MPAREPHRPPPSGDLSAVPAFLRAPARHAPADPEPTATVFPNRPLAMPRPVTPPPSTAPSRHAPPLDPASLPMPSLSRRRVVTAAGVLVAALLVLSFARQVGEATAASNRAAELRTANAALRDHVARLQDDLGHVRDQRFIRLEARAFGLGGPREIPFALAAGAPPLAADAPGSAAVRLGAETTPRSPFDAWLEVLFGTAR
jgi:cell division protein FtsB